MSEANPTTLSYIASTVKIFNATSSLVRFENKYFLLGGETPGQIRAWSLIHNLKKCSL
jgi:hypothetical protein